MTMIYARGTEPSTERGQGSTPEHLLTPQAQGVPDAPVPLRDAWTACAECGQAAPTPTTTNGRVSIVRWTENTTPAGQPIHAARITLTRCDTCALLHGRAARLVEAHPAMVARLGPAGAQTAAESVVLSLRLLGHPTVTERRRSRRSVPPATPSSASTSVTFGRSGGALTWQARATPNQANPHPFAHVRPAACCTCGSSTRNCCASG